MERRLRDPSPAPLAMNERPGRSPALEPFRFRDFRFQWTADLATSWAAEMETIILGWYVLVETGSVLLLTVFGSLQYTGTLIAPMLGVAGDRVGHRNLLCAMRSAYAVLAAGLTVAIFADAATPLLVFVIATLSGIVRPSDLVMRNALIGAIIPHRQLMGAMSVSRTTSDSARIAGALAGTGLVAALGMGQAYLAIVGLYAGSAVLTSFVGAARGRPAAPGEMHASPWRDLRDAGAYVARTPALLAAMMLAFLVNLTALPFFLGLLPYVARDVYRLDQAWLGYLVASFSSGALLGSIALGLYGRTIRAARTMIVCSVLWYGTIVAFGHIESAPGGLLTLAIAGFLQSLCMIPMSVVLLRVAEASFRGRVMGLRILAVYGLPLGLVISSPIIATFGFAAMAALYGGIGAMLTVLIGAYWRRHVWQAEAPANAQ